MESATHQVTKLLEKWSGGDEATLEQLMPLVHDELHRLAHHHMRKESPGHILQTSALINEAYLRLVDQPQIRFENRAHFFGIAARLMRRILVDDARKRNSAKDVRSRPTTFEVEESLSSTPNGPEVVNRSIKHVVRASCSVICFPCLFFYRHVDGGSRR